MSRDVVDAQIHLFLTMGMDQALAAMDSLGIQAALIDEFWGYDEEIHLPRPAILLANGAHRPVAPGAQMASMRHPARFKYLLRIDHRDPEAADVVRLARADRHCLALRIEARSPDELRDLAGGNYGRVFQAAADHGFPVFALTPGNVPLLAPSIARYPDCRIVIDHIGMTPDAVAFDALLALAAHPNVYLKWCHPHRSFDSAYPFAPAIAGLQRAIGAFGRERILWASDFTAVRTGHRWADGLFYLRDSDAIAEIDKDWILGRSVRELLDWPAPRQVAAPEQHQH